MKKETPEIKEENLNILDILFDEENDSPITLYNEEDKAIQFEQIAIIPLDEKIYAILKPVEQMDGVADDEALVFLINENEENGDAELIIEIDEPTLVKVFDEYYRMLESEGYKEPSKKD